MFCNLLVSTIHNKDKVMKHNSNTVEPLLSDPLEGVTIRSDNRRAKITGLNGVGRVGLRSDKGKFG